MRTNQRRDRRLRVRQAALRAVGKETFGVETDRALANALGVDHTNLSKLLRGHLQPGQSFIIAALDTFDRQRFEDLFEIVDADVVTVAA